jgi:phosphoserine aminotransferase
MAKKYNFSAGPAILPHDVMKKAQQELLDFNGIGLSIMEISHRSKDFEAVINGAEAKVRQLLGVPDNYHVLFLQGGASLQFGMIPMNLLKGGKADFVHTGEWAKKAIKEAKLFGSVNVAASSEDKNFSYIPENLKLSPDAAYVHVTSNETIGGIQWTKFPETGKVPLVADMSSDIFSRRIDVSKFGLIYAGAQKNIGPAGVTLVIIRNDLVERGPKELATMLQYRTYAADHSLYNTPPTFGIYIMGLVFKWIKKQGGLPAIEKVNRDKAGKLYRYLDESQRFRPTSDRDSRSLMNVTFVTGDAALDDKFIAQAKKAGLDGLKGHRSVGGMRASLYNAFPPAGVDTLINVMREFEAQNA